MNYDHLNTAECCIRDCQASAQRRLPFNSRVCILIHAIPTSYREAAELCQHVEDHGFVTIGAEDR